MNQRQRQALIDLIRAMIVEENSYHIEDTVRRTELEEDFHKCFEEDCQDEAANA
jgi:hypothetical protein